MKKGIQILIVLLVAQLGVLYESAAQRFVVRLRPVAPARVVVRPVCPGPRHVWIENEWIWNRRAGAYVSRPGYWAAPPRARAVWVPGHWTSKRRGHYWVPGRWR